MSEVVDRKNDFVKVSKNLARYRFENNFVWTIKNNYIGRLSVDDIAAKRFNLPTNF